MGVHQLVTNSIRDRAARFFPGVFGASMKHDHYKDFGWPDDLGFDQFHRMYSRNGLATAAVDKTIAKTWESLPGLWETEKPAESKLEEAIRKHLTSIRFWQAVSNVDRRGMIGAYSGAILLLGDGKKLEEPVDRVNGGILGLAGIIPAWEGQIKAVEWDNREDSPTYGAVTAYQFDEAAVGDPSNTAKRGVRIHPDRIVIWSEDGTINGRSTLEPGFNDLIDAEKVKGAGGEGFWKSSRGAPVIEAAAGMKPDDIVKMMAAQNTDDARDKLNERADDFQSGFDKMLMLGGLTATPLTITLPAPEHFFNIPVMSFAASMQIPVRILIGNQTGERASTEDAREWAQVCMGRRENIVLPCLYELIGRLVKWGILPAKDWTIGWASLLDATPDQQLDRAGKMAEINAKAVAGDSPPFLPEEIRTAAGFDPDTADWEREPEDTQSEADKGQSEEDEEV